MAQLKMQKDDLGDVPDLAVPEGYTLRNYRDGDEHGICVVYAESDLGTGTPELVREKILDASCFEPARLFVIETGDGIVATAAAWPNAAEPDKGYLHMVGVRPGHRGKRLGALVTLATIAYHRERGFTSQQLDTDDWREAALRLYLDLGYYPLLTDETHPARWQAIAEKLGRPDALERARRP